jgi:hypothetical protein
MIKLLILGILNLPKEVGDFDAPLDNVLIPLM